MSAADDDFTADELARIAASDRIEAEWAEREKASKADNAELDALLDRVSFSPGHYVRMLDAMPENLQQKALHAVRKKYPALVAMEKSSPDLQLMYEKERLRRNRQARREVDAEEREAVEKPPLVSLSDLLAEPDEDVAYRVDGLWPVGGRIVLAAQNKSGKTTTVNNLVRSLVDGDAFLGKFDADPVLRVVLIDNEMDARQTRRWLRKQGIRNTGSVTVINLRGRLSSFNILDPEVRREWADLIGPADVLIFDCLRPALDALGLSEQNEAGRFLEALDEFCAACDIPEALLVHHMGHQNERSRGDSRLEDWPDAKWKLVKQADRDELDPDEQRGPRFFSAFGRDVDQAEVRLHFDPDNHHLEVDGGSRVASTRSRIENEVLAYVTDNPGCSGSAIERDVLGDTNGKRDAARSLAAMGLLRIDRQGPGRATLHYPVPPEEQAAADFSESEAGENVENSDPENVENS